MTDKLRECFDEMVVYKDLKKSNFFSALGLPSFLRDWLLKRFSDDEGNLDLDELTDFVHTYLPGKDEWVSIKNRIIVEHEHVKLLTRRKSRFPFLILALRTRKQSLSLMYGIRIRGNWLTAGKSGESLNLGIFRLMRRQSRNSLAGLSLLALRIFVLIRLI